MITIATKCSVNRTSGVSLRRRKKKRRGGEGKKRKSGETDGGVDRSQWLCEILLFFTFLFSVTLYFEKDTENMILTENGLICLSAYNKQK